MSVRMLTDEHLSTYKVFKRDTKYAGTDVSKNSKIESWQRAKCLSSNYHCESRLNKLETLQDSIRNKKADKMKTYDNSHKNGLSCI